MREIKFRGKARNTLYNGAEILHHKGDWLYGDLIHQDGETFICPIGTRYPAGTSFKSFVVYPDSVGQYTCIKCNVSDTEIWEGDIIECWSQGLRAIGEVKRRRDGLYFMYPAWQNKQMWFLSPNEQGYDDIRVLGNVFDNPELLKGFDNEDNFAIKKEKGGRK